jgi:type I restriction enzyme S subunit
MIREGWTEATLDDLLDLIIDYRGKTPKKLGGDWQDSGIPAISAKNIKYGRIVREDSIKFVSDNLYKKWMKHELAAGDVLLTSEAPLGETLFLKRRKKMVLSQRLYALRSNPRLIDSRFLCYYLESEKGHFELNSRATGATAQGIRQSLLREVIVSFPSSLFTQRKIASILSAYDDLIENNLRRIKILEEMAQNLYREWFVKFRFPGYESVRMVDSPLGRIPQGWEVSTLREHLESLESGKRPKGGVKALQSGVPSVGAENVIGIGRHRYQSEKYVPREFFGNMRKGVVKNRDVALYKDGAYIGRSSYFRDGFPHDEFCVNEHVFLLRTSGKSLTQNLLYLWLQEPSNVSAIRSTNANAAQPGINQKGVKGLQILVAQESLCARLDQLVEPHFALIISLAKENQILRRTRDLLLPRLISGELDISELDIIGGMQI